MTREQIVYAYNIWNELCHWKAELSRATEVVRALPAKIEEAEKKLREIGL